MKVYAAKLGLVCSFRYKREAIACLPAIARALGVTVWARAPKGVMGCDLAARSILDDHDVESEPEDDSTHATVRVRCIVARP